MGTGLWREGFGRGQSAGASRRRGRPGPKRVRNPRDPRARDAPGGRREFRKRLLAVGAAVAAGRVQQRAPDSGVWWRQQRLDGALGDGGCVG